MWLALPLLVPFARAAAPPPLPPDARFALALFCAPTCDDAVFDALDASLAAIPAKDGFPDTATRPMRVMGIAGPEFGIPDAAFAREYGIGVDRPDDLAKSEEVLLAWFAGPRAASIDTFAAAHAAFALAAERAGGWVYDLDTQTIYSVAAWKATNPRGDLASWFMVDAEPMDPAAPDGALRVVTRGLRRFGDFELVVEDVAPDAAADVGFVVNAVATAAHGRDALPSPLTVATATVKGEASFAVAERRDTDPEDPVLRVRFEGEVTVPVEGGAESPPSDAPSASAPADAAPTTLEAAQAAARARLTGPVRAAFEAGLPPGDALAVKAPFRTRAGGIEYMWVEVRSWTGDTLSGVLANAPWDVPDLRKGDTVDVPIADVFDYVHKRADGTKDGNTTAAFLP